MHANTPEKKKKTQASAHLLTSPEFISRIWSQTSMEVHMHSHTYFWPLFLEQQRLSTGIQYTVDC